MAPLPRDRDKLSRMEQAVRVLIHGLGEDLDREGLRDTPKRVAKALLDCTQGYQQDTSSTLGTALFHEPIVHQGGEGVVVVRDIDFASTSEKTLLPFHGRCHVAYRPKDGVVLGLSKLARLTKQYAKRLQTQERLASCIALALQQSLECHGVAVVLRARHLANNAPPEERANACVSGVFAAKRSAELEELLALLDLENLPSAAIASLDCGTGRQLNDLLLGAGAISSTASPAADPGVPAPCTPDPSEKDTDGDSDDLGMDLAAVVTSAAAVTATASSCCCEEMEFAVQQLLSELGEDPHRPGLAGAARRYVSSLLASTSGYHMQLPLLPLQPAPPLGSCVSGRSQPATRMSALLQEQQQQQRFGEQQQGEGRPLLTRRQEATGLGCGAGDRGHQPAGPGCGGDLAGGVGGSGGWCDVGVGTDELRSMARTCSGAAGAEVHRPAGKHQHHVSHRACSVPGGDGPCGGGAVAAAACGGASSPVSSETALRTNGCAGPEGCRGAQNSTSCWPPPPAAAPELPTAPAFATVEVTAAAASGAAAGPLRGAVTLRLPFASQCEHHMLPFYGSLMVSYFPPAAAAAAPPLPRGAVELVVCMFTQRLQVQERITHQVADAVEALLQGTASPKASATAADASQDNRQQPCTAEAGEAAAAAVGATLDAAEEEAAAVPAAGDVMVVCDAAHMCMVARGVENHSGSTTTFAVRGAFAERPELRRAVLRLFREQQQQQ